MRYSFTSSLKHHNLLVLWSGLSARSLCPPWCAGSGWHGWTPWRSSPGGGRASVPLESRTTHGSAEILTSNIGTMSQWQRLSCAHLKNEPPSATVVWVTHSLVTHLSQGQNPAQPSQCPLEPAPKHSAGNTGCSSHGREGTYWSTAQMQVFIGLL